jgi:uncharacterized protein YdaU (DUF1376 family)
VAKDPAILFYTQDFLIGSSLLTPLQKGHYITLLCYQQQSDNGSLSLDQIKGIMKADFKKQWPAISQKFKEDENGFYNARMRAEMDRRKQSALKQKEKADKRWGNLKEPSRSNAAASFRHNNGNAFHISTAAAAKEIESEIGKAAPEKSSSLTNQSEKTADVLGSEKVQAAADAAWKDQLWRENLCQSLYIKSEDELKKWMARFNASLSTSIVSDFDEARYKRMIGGWIPKQQGKGISIDKPPTASVHPSSGHHRFKKIN